MVPMTTTASDQRLPVRLSRRRFVQAAGASSLLVALESGGWLSSVVSSLELDGDVLTTHLFRPEDQLRLQIDFLNLVHDAANNRLVASGGTPMMRLILPRQHVSEQPIASGTVPPGSASAPGPHAAAANSRLVFVVNAPIDFTVEALLDLASHTLTTTLGEGDPDDLTSMIEIPANLRWSPAADVSARTDVAPFTVNGVSQLHRLFLEGPGGAFDFTPVFNTSNRDGFTGRIPSAGSRNSIVSAATGGVPATAERLWLTPHGAWADLAGDWDTVEWIQRVQGGRDQFAQVVERGMLMPFGVPAVWTETATRLWLVDADGDVVSTMVSETHFAVTDGDSIELSGEFAEYGGREMPFRSIRVDGDDNYPAAKRQIVWDDETRGINQNNAWVVTHGGSALWAGSDVRVNYCATDSIGQEARFSLAALFVRGDALDNTTLRTNLVDFFASAEGDSFRRRSIGSDVAWAEPILEGVGSTSQRTLELEFGLELVDATDVELANAGALPIQPRVTRGTISNPSIDGELEVRFSPAYLEFGNDEVDNPTLAYLELETPKPFPLGVEARAVMTPEMDAEELNQTLGIGPIADEVAEVTVWRPEDAFGEAATILKGVKLSDIVGPVAFDVADLGIDIPAFESLVLPDRLQQTYSWCPSDINSFEDAGFIVTADTELCLEITSTIGLSPGVQSGIETEFRVTDFTLMVPPLIGLIELNVAELRGVQPVDGPADLTFDIEDWTLIGALSFLDVLFKKFTPSGSDFDIDIDSTTITADLDLPLPKIDLGVLAIKNFNVGLTGSFPYQGEDDPSIAIEIGTKKNPVDIQIMQFGGGFRLELALDTKGMQSLEIYAEVSARLVEIDIKIATAYCEVGVSAEFKLNSAGEVTFIGKLWMEASFNVLGLVGATLNITGKVRYKEPKEKLTFSGTIHWSVTALFTFSGKVPIGSIDFKLGDGQANGFAGRALTGGGGHLAQAASADGLAGGFGDVHSYASWTDYVSKFAPEAV